ncbi:MAG: choice-of-anchor B family protein [Phycisphaerales bacterium]|nr:choice-of-anchor B family protein [Phycisphaerales bacterium]
MKREVVGFAGLAVGVVLTSVRFAAAIPPGADAVLAAGGGPPSAGSEAAESAVNACCLPDGSCLPDVTGSLCRGNGGWDKGTGTSCTPNLCTPFPASGVELLSWVPKTDFPDAINHTNGSNDLWGYVSPSGREYAFYGLWSGTGFIEVTNPANPVIIDYIDGPNSVWRDVEDYQGHAYIVSQEGLGVQVVNLSQIDSGMVSLVQTETFDNQLFVSHTITINKASGYAYLDLTDYPNGDGLVAINLSNPNNLTIDGVWNEVRIHEPTVLTYDSGPYAGREIAFGCAEGNGLYVVDVTDKGNMFTRSSTSYPNVSYSHEGWLTADRRYFLLGDELDELEDADVPTTTTYVIDVQDLDNVQYVTTFTNGLATIDHNLYVRGNYAFETNYEGGLRIFDVSDVFNVQEVGFYDTYPERNGRDFSFNGAWGNYPFLPSRIVMVADRNHGLFILDASAAVNEFPSRIELAPVGGTANAITADPGDVVVLDVMVSDWSGLLQGVQVELEPSSLATPCGAVLTLFNGDGDDNGACDPGSAAYCPTCAGEVAAGHFDGVYIDDCRADHFSNEPPTIPLDAATVDPGNLKLSWLGQSGGVADPLAPRYVGSFVLQVPGDAYGDFQVTLKPSPLTSAVIAGQAGPSPSTLVGATIHLTAANAFGDVNHDGMVDIFDILCVLDGFAGVFTTCPQIDVDIMPCAPDGLIDIFDILAVLDAFSGDLQCCDAP